MNLNLQQIAKRALSSLSHVAFRGDSISKKQAGNAARKRSLSRALSVESLESRKLSAVDVSLTSDGILRVIGDEQHNYVDFYESNGQYQIYAIRNRLDATPDLPKVQTFSMSQVKSLFIDGGAGDDLLNNRTIVPTVMFGGAGVDNLWGGYGANELYDTSVDTVFQNQGLVMPSTGLGTTLRSPQDQSPLALYYGKPGVSNILGLPTNNNKEFTSSKGTRYRTYQNGLIVMSGEDLTHVTGETLKKWQSLGGIDNATLGNPKTIPPVSGVNRIQGFESGAIVDRDSQGVFEFHGAIYGRWANDASIRNTMGFPRSDEQNTPDGRGRQSLFDGGRLVWDRATNRVSMIVTPRIGVISPSKVLNDQFLFMTSVAPERLSGKTMSPTTDAFYTQMGRERGALGPLVRGERIIASKMVFVTQFQNGAIYRTQTSTFAVYGDIYKKYIASGGPIGFLGLPQNSESAVGDSAGGRFNRFENGAIYWTPARGAFEVHGAIYQEWLKRGGTRSSLGYPTSDELGVGPVGEFRLSKFQNGALSYSPSTGVIAIDGAIWREWTSMGAERSYLGAPVAAPWNNQSPGLVATNQEFAGGTLTVFLNQSQTGITGSRVDFRFDQMKWAMSHLASDISTVSSSKLSQIQSLLVSRNTMPEYVRNLATKLVNGDPANAFHRNWTLGNLRVGFSQQQFLELVDKWFGGGERPRAVDASYTAYDYKLATGPLFGPHGPMLLEINQGSVGDCYFVATLGSLAAKNPQAIRDMFIDNGDGTYSVRFFNRGRPEYVTVDTWLPSRNDKLVYALEGRPLLAENANSSRQGLWLALAEKAFVVATASGWTGQSADGGYGSAVDTSTNSGILSGSTSSVLRLVANIDSTFHSLQVLKAPAAMTGIIVPDVVESKKSIDSVKDDMMKPESRNTLVATSKYLTTSKLAVEHVYVLLFATDTGITLLNPWGIEPGTDAIVSLTWNEVYGSISEWVHY
jgi:uncharacterized protein with LGFP repeats